MVTTDPSYFQAIPWCAAILSDPQYAIVPSRFGQPNEARRGEFFTRTLATDDTISACIYQRREANRTLTGTSLLNPTAESPPPAWLSSLSSPCPPVPEVRAFLATSSGLNGFPGIAHGGFVAAIIDEVMGFLINSNQAMTEAAGIAPNTSEAATTSRSQFVPMTVPGSSVVTAELTVKYRSPVPTGEVLLVRAWIEHMRERKIVVKATIEDSERGILSEGHGLFIALKPGVSAPPRKKVSAKI